jgi:hypothetical protein
MRKSAFLDQMLIEPFCFQVILLLLYGLYLGQKLPLILKVCFLLSVRHSNWPEI